MKNMSGPIIAMLRNQKNRPRNMWRCHFKNCLVVITGTTSGIGYVTAKKYASHGAEILCINRNEQKSIELYAEDLRKIMQNAPI